MPRWVFRWLVNALALLAAAALLRACASKGAGRHRRRRAVRNNQRFDSSRPHIGDAADKFADARVVYIRRQCTNAHVGGVARSRLRNRRLLVERTGRAGPLHRQRHCHVVDAWNVAAEGIITIEGITERVAVTSDAIRTSGTRLERTRGITYFDTKTDSLGRNRYGRHAADR